MASPAFESLRTTKENSGTGGPLTDDDTINITVTPINDAPTIATNAGMTVNEGSAGNVITTAMLNEGDVDDDGTELTYTVTNLPVNGTLFLAGFGTLGLNDSFTQADIDAGDVTYDHDDSETTADSFDFSLADGGEDGASPVTGTFNITVTLINDNSVGPISDTDLTLENVTENVPIGATVGIAAFASDADAGDTVTYSLTSNPDGLFQIDSNTGVVTTAAAIDRETHGAVRAITVQAQSSDGSTQTQNFNITINDSDEFNVTVPVDSDGAVNEVDENVAIGTMVGLTASAFDNDATNNTVTYSLTSNPDGLFQIDSNTGIVTTAAAIDREVHGANRNITVRADSSDGSFDQQVFSININNVDEAPVLTTNNPLSVPEEGTRTITTAYLAATDVDTTSDQIVYELTQLPGGTGRVRLNGSTLSLGQTFTQDDIENNRVTFRFDDEASVTDFRFTITDGTTTSTEIVFTVHGTAVNDAPVVVAPASALSATEQIGLAIHGTGFSVTDVDEAGSGARAVISVGEGIISISEGDSGITIDSGNNTSAVTVLGSIAQINNLLSGGGTGTITYLNNNDSPNASTTITVLVNDAGNTGADPGMTGDGTSEEGSNSQIINISAVNDDPTNAGGLPTDITVTEDLASNVDLGLINLSDVDSATGNLTITLTTGSGGMLSANTSGGVTVGGSGTGVLTLSGNQSNLNTFLDVPSNIQFTSALNVNGDDADSIQVDVTDNGNFGAGGGGTINFGTVSVDITADNDTPTLGNNNLTLLEGETVVLDASMISAADVDDAGPSLTFNVSSVNGGHFALAATPQTLINSFTQAQVTGGQIVFVHDGGESTPSYDVSVTDGNSSTAPASASVGFTNVNDAPVLASLGGDSVTVPNDGTPTLLDTGAAAMLQDSDLPVDYDGATLILTSNGFLAPDLLGIDTSGSISLSAGISDGSVLSIGGSSMATLSGTSASGMTLTFNANATAGDIDTILQSVSFQSTSATLGNRSVDFVFNDGDGTANGGDDTSPTTSVHISLASADDGLVTTNEDTTYAFVATDFDFTGVIGNDLVSITVTGLPTDGTLTLGGVPVDAEPGNHQD